VNASDATFLVSGLQPGSQAYTPNNLNQYAAVGAQSLSYDANGNLISDGAFTYGYDTESRLISSTYNASGGAIASYAYDPQGRRKAKTVNGTTTNYLSAGSREIAEYDGAGNLLRRYVYGLDEPLATIDAAGNISYHFTDAQGSVVALANASGQVTETHAYTAYGLAASTAGTAFQFTGRRVDTETGLYYYRARYYSPAIGRFLQTDPIGTGGGINLYAYVSNDPVNNTDPFGLCDNPQGCGNSGQVMSDVSQDPIVPGEQYAQAAMALCAAGPPGCAVGTGITAGQLLLGGALLGGALILNSDTADRPPAGSRPIDQTPWSGDHGEIKEAIGATGTTNVKISPTGDVWAENPDGSWTNHGPAGSFTGSGQPSGRRGKDRDR
jgi:RHS repeat-associated protein